MSRILLMKYILIVLRLGGRVFYIDTDSIITNVKLPSSTLLGELKDEIPEWSGQLKGEFLGPKMYILKSPEWTRVKAKGLESGQRTEETIRKLVRGSKRTAKGLEIAPRDRVYVRRLEKVGTLAQANFMRGPKIKKVPRRLLIATGKREMLKNGSTKAIRVQMWVGEMPTEMKKWRN